MIKLVTKEINSARSPLQKDRSPTRGVHTANLCQPRNTSQERMKVSQSPTTGSKIKIRVVSPLRKDMDLNTTRENSPQRYARTCNTSPACSPPKIAYGPIMTNRPLQKPTSNKVSNLSIKQHFQPQLRETHRRPSPKYSNFVIMDSHHPSFHKKNHPQKISINNKTFDLGTIKSQIIYVAPFKHIRNASKEGSMAEQPQDLHSNEGSWAPNQPSIQEEVESESLKGSSKSQQSQPQQEVQERVQKQRENLITCTSQEVCISELVFSQREQQNKSITKMLNFQDIPIHESRMQSETKVALPITTQKTLINELDFETDKKLNVSIKRDAASVQTDRTQESTERGNKGKLSRFAIIKNLEYQIEAKVECSTERQVIEEMKEVEEVQEDIIKHEQAELTEIKQFAEHEEIQTVVVLQQKTKSVKEETLIKNVTEEIESNQPQIHVNLEPSISNTQNYIPSASSIIPLKEETNLPEQPSKASITKQTDRVSAPFSKQTNLQKEQVSLKQFSKKAEQASSFSTRSIKQNSEGFKKPSSKRSITNNIYR